MNAEKKFPDTKLFLMGVILVFGLLFVWLSYYFLVPIVLAIVIGIIFRPLYLWLKKSLSSGIAVTLAILIIVVAIIIPSIIVFFILFSELTKMPVALNEFFIANSITIDSMTNSINSFLASFNISPITSSELTGYIQDLADLIRGVFLQWIFNFAVNSFTLITQAFVFFFVLSGVLMYAPEFRKYIVKTSPIDSATTTRFITRTKIMSLMMTKGVFLIAIIQGALVSLLLWLLGIPFFVLFGLIAVIFTIIPVGAGIVTIPLAIVALLTGDYLTAIILLLYTLIIITNLPNFLRPRLVKGKINVRPSIVLISILGGMAVFGFWGVIYGPVIMVILITALETYAEQFKPKTDDDN